MIRLATTMGSALGSGEFTSSRRAGVLLYRKGHPIIGYASTQYKKIVRIRDRCLLFDNPRFPKFTSAIQPLLEPASFGR